MDKDDGISHATGKNSYHPNDYEQGHLCHPLLNDFPISASCVSDGDSLSPAHFVLYGEAGFRRRRFHDIKDAAEERERDCINDYEQQRYERR